MNNPLAQGTIVNAHYKGNEKVCIIDYVRKEKYVICYWMDSIDDQWLGAKEKYSQIEIRPEDIVEIYRAGTKEYLQFIERLLEIGRAINENIADLLGKDNDIQYPCGDKFGSYLDQSLGHTHNRWLVRKLPRIVREQNARYDTPED